MRRRTVCQIPLRSTNTNITNYTTFTVPCVDNILLILKHLFMSFSLSGFGGLGVSVLASGTGVCGFKPGRTRRIFRAKKILSTPSFGGGSKAVGPMSYFASCKRPEHGVEVVIWVKFIGQYSRPSLHPTRISRVLQAWRYLAAKVWMSKDRGGK